MARRCAYESFIPESEGWEHREASVAAKDYEVSDPVSVKMAPADMSGFSSLRGARGTNQAVKDFWMACRGTSLAYTS